MDKWTTLEPVKLYGAGASSSSSVARRSLKPPPAVHYQYIGPLPADIHVLVLEFLPITSLPAYARASRALSRLTHDERLWKKKCDALGLQKPAIAALLANLETPDGGTQSQGDPSTPHAPVLDVPTEEDDFGDFASAPLSPVLNTSQALARDAGRYMRSPRFTDSGGFEASKPNLRTIYIHAHYLLAMLSRRLTAAPHLLLSELFPPPSPPSVLQQSKTLRLLSKFLSPLIQPIKAWPELRLALASAIDRFQANMLATFESADTRGDEKLMTEAAWASWESWNPSQGSRNEWELGKVWAEKLEIFYEGGRWDPLQNFTSVRFSTLTIITS